MKESSKPEIERTCPRCGENRMSYATIQLRSADEGQTVFLYMYQLPVSVQY